MKNMTWMAVEDFLRDEACHLQLNWVRDRGYQCSIYLYTMIDSYARPVVSFSNSPEKAVSTCVVLAKEALRVYREIQDRHEDIDSDRWS